MNKILVMVLSFTFVVSCASGGSGTSNNVAEDDTKQKADEVVAQRTDGYRCERVRMTGQRIKRKVCSTKSERDYAREIAKEAMERVRSGSARSGTPPQ